MISESKINEITNKIAVNFNPEKDVKYTFINDAMKTSKLLYERN